MSKYIRPVSTAGMRHLALNVNNLENSVDFYTRLLGMEIEWQPDADNYYLTSGNDNLALHRAAKTVEQDSETSSAQSLDHLGFIIDSKQDVVNWFNFLKQENIEMLTEVKDHRDGARSFYCKDPDGNAVQIIYHPPLSLG
ncbi:Putative ring-cleaving dioxygenase [hydrothermal vent metagenome]|uniref:Ring-cleaving dioxygenase n=1 Tax=hydrothermal vent metagenome TaxID=652676 RepID=A0A3B0WG61_9ZZZZ